MHSGATESAQRYDPGSDQCISLRVKLLARVTPVKLRTKRMLINLDQIVELDDR